MASLQSQVQRIVSASIEARQTPGAVVLIGRGHEIVLHEAYGQRAVVPEPLPMLPDTTFDMASVTKPVATATVVMQLVEQGQLDLRQPISHWFPGFAPAITPRHLMTHSSGLKPYKNYLHEWGDSIPAAQRRRKVVADIATLPLDYETGQGFAYSCLNYVVIASLVRKVSGLPLDVVFGRYVAAPMGLVDSRFKPTNVARCAPSEPLPEGVLCGVVHDEIARYLGGVGGNAGLFSTAADVSRFMRMVLHGGELDGVRVLQKKTVRAMTSPAFTLNKLQRGLGWDIASPYTPSVRGRFPEGSFGHTGFTGTSIWADPASRVYLIILTNRVHYGRDASVMGLRHKLANLVAKHVIEPIAHR